MRMAGALEVGLAVTWPRDLRVTWHPLSCSQEESETAQCSLPPQGLLTVCLIIVFLFKAGVESRALPLSPRQWLTLSPAVWPSGPAPPRWLAWLQLAACQGGPGLRPRRGRSWPRTLRRQIWVLKEFSLFCFSFCWDLNPGPHVCWLPPPPLPSGFLGGQQRMDWAGLKEAGGASGRGGDRACLCGITEGRDPATAPGWRQHGSFT